MSTYVTTFAVCVFHVYFVYQLLFYLFVVEPSEEQVGQHCHI